MHNMYGPTLEKRPLKKPRLGPPDVYPQDPKQKEDELTPTNVKQGFSHTPQLSEEYGSARNLNIPLNKITAYYNAVISKKQELNTLPDTGRKRQQINPKDFFIFVRNKASIETWFKDLAGNKPLANLSKKIPILNKKEEIFMTLCEYLVPMVRAMWFIKMTAAYCVAISEAKTKKRQSSDPSHEWTVHICRFMKEQLNKLQEYYQKSNVNHPMFLSMGSGAAGMTEEHKQALKHWNYCQQLSKVMFEEGLLDRQEFLQWIVDLLDEVRSVEDGWLRLLVPLTLQYLDEIVQCELLSRKACFAATKRLAILCHAPEVDALATPQNSNAVAQLSPASSPLAALFSEFNNCTFHRGVLLGHSTVVQTIVLHCPTACVWSPITSTESKASPCLVGSPLDPLPLPPSALPMPPRANNPQLRAQLRTAEEQIRNRSKASENRWSMDKLQQSTEGAMINRILSALDALDRHSFDRVDANNSLEGLYDKIFAPVNPKDLTPEGIQNILRQDEPLVRLLCEWAVSDQRHGEHRAMAAAWLLDKRQSDLTPNEEGPETETVEGESNEGTENNTTTLTSNTLPVFQNLLMKFLDTDAPVLGSPATQSSKTVFASLVHLFYELIRYDVFSHDAYMCTLISRGDLFHAPPPAQASAPPPPNPVASQMVRSMGHPHMTPQQPQHPSQHGHMGMYGADPMGSMHQHQMRDPFERMDTEDSKIDDDIYKLVHHIKEGHMDAPDSPKEEGSSGLGHSLLETTTNHEPGREDKRQSRHLLYTTHFPLPQDESVVHDCNQRHVLLYGVGKAREEARHTVKKMSKEIGKLFHKKLSIDVNDGGKPRKHSRNEFNFDAVLNKFLTLSYFDRHVVTSTCVTQALEMLTSFAANNSSYLPVQEHLSFLFDLLELALNINGILELCLQILKELPDVESQLLQKGSPLARSYCTSLGLYLVGVLRRFHMCLLLSPEQTSLIFEGCCKLVKHVTNPGDCTSAERCILAYLYDMYPTCAYLRAMHSESRCELFANAYPKIRQTLYSSVAPSTAVHNFSRDFMKDYVQNTRKKIDSQVVKQLSDNPALRYSLVCNVVIQAASLSSDAERLHELALLCAELTACCNSLSAEWLGILAALCTGSQYFVDVRTSVDIQDLSIHPALALLFAVIVARHGLQLQDFLLHAGIPSLLKAWTKGRNDLDSDPETETEAGARLTLHILLRLFRTPDHPQSAHYALVGASPHPQVAPGQLGVKLTCDRHLLAACHNKIDVKPVVAVLKAILLLADLGGGATDSTRKKDSGNSRTPVMNSELSISHILGTSDLTSSDDNSDFDFGMGFGGKMGLGAGSGLGGGGAEHMNLSSYARHVLKQICSQAWVHDRCLQNPEDLLTQDAFLDSTLTPKQAQRLLHMICRPELSGMPHAEEASDMKQQISRILEQLDQWRLRVSCLDLQLMCKQLTSVHVGGGSAQEISQFLDSVARAAIDVFQLTPQDSSSRDEDSKEVQETPQSIWLVAPLVARLPSAVQGKVLKVASQVLESSNWQKGKNMVARQRSLALHQPFLSLVMTCLKGQDDQKEILLASLHSQLSHFVSLSKDDKLYPLDHGKARQSMLEALSLRFSLLGGMFDAIQRSSNTIQEWAILLAQLVVTGVIDMANNTELFATVVDMLATLIHSTLMSEASSERGEETKKYYQNLMKKLKKELPDRRSPSVRVLWQLLPIPKRTYDVITCEPMGSITDTKGNKIPAFDPVDKKQGLQLHEKQSSSPWDLLEGHKTPSPLSWAWFGAVRTERKTLKYQEMWRLLRYHSHSLAKPSSYFMEHPPLPPEELEPPPERLPKEEIKADTPSSDQSPRAKRQKSTQRRPRQKRGGANNVSLPTTPVTPVPHIGYQSPGIYPANQQPQWGAYNPNMPQQQPMPPQQAPPPQAAPQQAAQQPGPGVNNFYSQQIAPGVNVGGPRFERQNSMTQSRQALTNMLRARLPATQFMAGPPSGPGPQGAGAGGVVNPNNVQAPNGPVGNVVPGPGAGPPRGPGPQPFQNMQMMDKQRQQQQQQQQFIRQQLRAGMQVPPGANGNQMYGSGQGMPMSNQQPQANNMFPMQQGMNQNFGMYQGNQNQTQPNPVQANQGNMQPGNQQGQQSFNQGGANFNMQQMGQPRPEGNGNFMPQQRAMAPRAPFMQGGNMGMVGQQGYGRPPMQPNQQQVRMQQQQQQQQQQQMMMQQQQQQQQPNNMQSMQHNMGQQQHNPYHQGNY